MYHSLTMPTKNTCPMYLDTHNTYLVMQDAYIGENACCYDRPMCVCVYYLDDVLNYKIVSRHQHCNYSFKLFADL